MKKADLVINNVLVYNSVFQKFYSADVYVLDGRIYYTDLKKEHLITAGRHIDGTGKYMVPGLVDVHMHIESSMMTPQSMAYRLAQCGVTTVVSEPHEMANVNGPDGIRDMMEAGKSAPIDIYYGIPSCVPSTSSSLETTGGIIDFEQMKNLMKHPMAICVGEVMNYRQIIHENDLEIGKFLDYLRNEDPLYTIEGHCPALKDLDLASFAYLGIDSDHTEHDIEELKQRFFNGMFIELQDKMVKKEVLHFIDQNDLYGHFGFVTDDVMADTLMDEGHLDAVVRKAIRLGMTPEKAVYHATYTNAVRMKLTDRTMLAPGKLADFILLDDLESFQINSVYKRGSCIYDRNCISTFHNSCTFPDSYHHMVHVDPVDETAFFVPCSQEDGTSATVEVMRVTDGSTKTTRTLASLPVKNGEIQWEDSPYLLALVFERYGKSGREPAVGLGFVTGDCIRHGAVATTFAHDHHNLLAVGSSKKDLCLAVNKVIEAQGGIAVADSGSVCAFLPLEIGGIISDAAPEKIADGLKKVRTCLICQGYHHYNPIMSLCTLSLLASPALKISDKGLIDVTHAQIVPLIRDPGDL